MSYPNTHMASIALLAISAGACVGVALSFTSGATAMYAAPTAVRANPVAVRTVAGQPMMGQARAQRTTMDMQRAEQVEYDDVRIPAYFQIPAQPQAAGAHLWAMVAVPLMGAFAALFYKLGRSSADQESQRLIPVQLVRAPAQPWSMAAVTGNKITRTKPSVDLEGGETPMNTFTKDNTFTGVIKSVESLVGPGALAEHCNIVIETKGEIPCREGQCYGIIPPGVQVNEKTGEETPHYARQYSIASSRYGDSGDGQTTTLCVKKVAWWDKDLGGMKKELCSHYLCDATPGTEVTMTGPSGRSMLLDPNPDAVHICVCTGTGIAPYRAFWRRMFYEQHDNFEFKGQLWIFFGAANSDELLYAQELADLQATYPDQVKVFTAYAEEETAPSGEKMYVQDRVAEQAADVFKLLDSGAHLYCSGSKFMMPGILEMLEKKAAETGKDWEEWQAGLKADNKWHVEVY